MKKLVITIAIVLGLSLTSLADPNGGVFGRGETSENQTGSRLGGAPMLPGHGQSTNQPAPISSGILVLTALGAVYLIG